MPLFLDNKPLFWTLRVATMSSHIIVNQRSVMYLTKQLARVSSTFNKLVAKALQPNCGGAPLTQFFHAYLLPFLLLFCSRQ